MPNESSPIWDNDDHIGSFESLLFTDGKPVDWVPGEQELMIMGAKITSEFDILKRGIKTINVVGGESPPLEWFCDTSDYEMLKQEDLGEGPVIDDISFEDEAILREQVEDYLESLYPIMLTVVN